MSLDQVGLRRHRWIVIILILVGALSVLIAASSLFLMRQHITSTTFSDEVHQALLNEVDYRLIMAGFTMLCFTVGLFSFFIALTLDISYRQKAIVVYIARLKRSALGSQKLEAETSDSERAQ